MRDVQETCRIALVQAEPVMFDKENGLKKALRCQRRKTRNSLCSPSFSSRAIRSE